MGKCLHHADRETGFKCSKHDLYLCRECLACRDPKIYCKFRSACTIWYMRKTSETWGDEEEGGLPNPKSEVAI